MSSHVIDSEFKEICRQILAQNLSLSKWAAIESDDMFQSENYVGGFDADEMEFCFSVYREDGEWWFQLSMASIQEIVAGNVTEIRVVAADR